MFGSYNYLRKGQEQTINLERVTGTGSDVLETLFQSDRNPTQNNHNFRLGLDVEASEKTTLGFLISGYNNRWDMDADNRTEILPAAAPDTLALFRNVEENYWQHFQGNFNLLHTFTNKSVLNLDFDYLAYDNQNPVTYDLRFEGRDGTLFDQSNLASEKNTPFTIIVGKFDYEIPLGEKAKLSVGTKYVTSEFENAISLTDDGVVQPNFTSVSDLSEDIFALYAQGDYQLSEKTTLKAGLRYENTDSELNSTNGGRVVDRRLDNLFPSIFINRKLGEYSSVNLSYARRIDRPSFSSLAPFVIFLDPNTSFGGNAGLRPALANTFQLDYNKKQFSLSAQYTDEDFTIVGFQNRFD
ncbi:MAG: outer membrane beta-barrel family protein, partial [Bacteroidota bacterium]